MELKPCPYGVNTCMCFWCEKPYNNGLQCKEFEWAGEAVHDTYLCTGCRYLNRPRNNPARTAPHLAGAVFSWYNQINMRR